MNRPILFFLGAVLLGAPLGCEKRETATLCVFSAAEAAGVAPASFDCGVDPTAEPPPSASSTAANPLVRCPTGSIDEAGAYFLRHDLPAGSAPIGKLQIHMETPCASAERDIEATHVDAEVLFPFTPPKGASCAFFVSATMAQSELGCTFVRQPPEAPGAVDPCADLDTLCAETSAP